MRAGGKKRGNVAVNTRQGERKKGKAMREGKADLYTRHAKKRHLTGKKCHKKAGGRERVVKTSGGVPWQQSFFLRRWPSWRKGTNVDP